MKILLVTLVMMFCTTTCFAADDWSTQDVVLQGMALGSIAADWAQARHIVSHPESHNEQNPFLTGTSNKHRADLYFISVMLLHTGIIHIMPSDWRPYFQAGTIAFEMYFVGGNYELGTKIKF